jgi:hypothetical protein
VALAKQIGSATSSLSNGGWKASSSWRSAGKRRGWWTCGKRGKSELSGYTFRNDRDLKGLDRKYLNVVPSKKSIQERERLREMTDCHQRHKPIPALIRELNRHLKGWMNYSSFGYPLQYLL